MKKPEYTAGVVSVYRKYLDKYLSGEKGRSSLKRTNRCCGIFITGMVFTRAITSSETDGP